MRNFILIVIIFGVTAAWAAEDVARAVDTFKKKEYKTKNYTIK
jgi:hypothetical protein